MPAVARLGDSVFSQTGRGKRCAFPLNTSIASASSRVFADGIGIARGGLDKVAAHPRGGCSPDSSLIIQSSSRFFIEGQPAARIGDSAPSDNTLIAGSSRVFFG
jgi:uncharacterized Zn-binding protein involved in type VI secretion